jgi:membrane protease YdiL (CAAX protease family)
MLGTLTLELGLGWVKIAGTFVAAPGVPFAATILLGFMAVAAVAFGEEASYRAYPIKNFTEGLGRSPWAVVAAVSIPAVYFGMAHITNPGATWLSSTNTVIFGLLCGAAFVLTGELAVPLGLHFAWDYIQAFVFGVVGDGSQYGAVLVLAPSGASERHWTGLPYGVEAGALGTLALITGFVLMVAWIRIRPAQPRG